MCVLKSYLSDCHLIFDDLHLQISKTHNGYQNVKKPPYFLWFFANESTMHRFCKIYIKLFFQVSLERNNLYLTFKYTMFVVYYIVTVTICIPLKMLTIYL